MSCLMWTVQSSADMCRVVAGRNPKRANAERRVENTLQQRATVAGSRSLKRSCEVDEAVMSRKELRREEGGKPQKEEGMMIWPPDGEGTKRGFPVQRRDVYKRLAAMSICF